MPRLFWVMGLLCLSISPTFADAIDGDWCNDTNEHIAINGPMITLPDGKVVSGTYRRHEFAYRTPVGDGTASETIVMQLFSDDDMTSYVFKDMQTTSPMAWKRCKIAPKTS